MGLFSRFEDKAEDLIEGSGSSKYGGIEPVKLAKRAYKEMQREKMVGVGHEYAPTLYNVLVSPQDDQRMSGMYPSLAGEIETYLTGRAESSGLVFDCPPLVRFIVDEGLKAGRFDIIAESVSPSIIEELRREEMEHYGIQEHKRGGGMRDDANLQPLDAYGAEPAARGRGYDDYGHDPYGGDAYGRDDYAQEAPAPAPAFDPLAPADMQDAVYTPSPEEIAQVHPERDMRPVPEPVPEPAAQPRPQPRPQPLRPQPASASAHAADAWEEPPAQQQQPQRRPAAQPAPVQAGAQPAPAIRSYLYDPQTRRRFPLDADRVVVGREISCDIQVNDPSVSRHHAEVTRTAQGWAIRDTGSTNGTAVNDTPVSQSRIYNGDRIRLGNTQLVFQEG